MTKLSCESIAPTSIPALMCLDAEGAILFATPSARKLCERWNEAIDEASGGGQEAGRDYRLPVGIGSLLREAEGRGCDVHTSSVRVRHPNLPQITVTIHTGAGPAEMESRPYCLLMFTEEETRPAAAERTLGQLTRSERRVALLVAEGLCNEEIAQRLQRSRRTIEYQLSMIFRKLDLTRRTQLVRVLV